MHVVIEIEPLPAGTGFEFVNKIVGGVIPKEYIPAVKDGIEEALQGGVLAGYPIIDLRASLVFGSYHDVDSSEIAFKIAGSMAFKEGFMKAKPVLLEPIMAVEVEVPEEFMGDVIGDISSRRGRIEGMETIDKHSKVKALVPLSEMFGYATDVRQQNQRPRYLRHGIQTLRRSTRQYCRRHHQKTRRRQRQIGARSSYQVSNFPWSLFNEEGSRFGYNID